jgi:hypothetical protein
MRVPNLAALLKWWQTYVPAAYSQVRDGKKKGDGAGPGDDEILDGDGLVGLLGKREA